MSRDHKFLAYIYDVKGDEQYSLVIKDLESGKLLPENIPSIAGLAWNENSTGIFYVSALNEKRWPDKLYYHDLSHGSNNKEDVLIYQENDNGMAPNVYWSSDESQLFLSLSNVVGNYETHRVDTNNIGENKFVSFS